MGIVFVLLLGEIDLSVGYVSGVAGVHGGDAAHARRQRAAHLARDRRWPSARAPRSAPLHGLLVTRIGIPSFVVTLAGLLGWNGVVLLLIGRAAR